MKKMLCVLISVILLCSVCSGMMASAASDYTIVSPYEDVVWSGGNAWGAYRGVLHSHTTWSDADVDLPEMVKEYYSLGYDFLANSDHAVTGVEWNKKPKLVTPYWYQYFLGNKLSVLTDDLGFGEVECDLESTIDRIIEYVENGCKLKPLYRERIDKFFAFHDRDNCRRVVEKILSLPKNDF